MAEQDGAGSAPQAGTSDAENADKDKADKQDAEYQGKHAQEDPRLSQARGEAIDERKKRQEAESELKKMKDAQLSEEERRTNRIAELEAEHAVAVQTIQELRTSSAIATAAAQGKVRYPEDIPKLIDIADVKYDADGRPTNANDLVDKLKARRPELFEGPGSADGGARGAGPAGAQNMNDWLRQKAGR